MNWWNADPRITIRRGGVPVADGRCVVYWMQRAQRALDNPALETAIRAANELRKPVVVFFALLRTHPVANLRHYAFMIEGLVDTAARLRRRGIGIVVRATSRNPVFAFVRFCDEIRPAMVVLDENPLRNSADWRIAAAKPLRIPVLSVDADVIVPSILLEKEQYAARTIRPRIHRMLPRYLRPVVNANPAISWNPRSRIAALKISIGLLKEIEVDGSIAPIAWAHGGTTEALTALDSFVASRLSGYAAGRNVPVHEGTSRLSPYLHFGHLGPHTVALAVLHARAPANDRDAYLEELIVRRELAVNFVRFNPRYDRLEGCEPWARKTLRAHSRDRRSRIYSEAQFERAATDDALWNAAQRQMVQSGWMHGYIRMYWAKKILEWSRSPADAFRIATRLNDKYELDGRDPNGYAGIAWSIGGKHDRALGPERPIFGLIRYMSLDGVKRKLDVQAYIDRWSAQRGEQRG